MAGVLLEFNYSRLLLGLNLVTRVSEACGKELGPKAGKRARNAPNYGIQVLGGTDTPSGATCARRFMVVLASLDECWGHIRRRNVM